MIDNPAIGMRVRFYRDNTPANDLNNRFGSITDLHPWGMRTDGVVTVHFDDVPESRFHGTSYVCSLGFLYPADAEEEKQWKIRNAENQQRTLHAMKFL